MNIKSAKELLNKYKSITLEQLEEKWEERCYYFSDPDMVDGLDVMGKITGFGSTESCLLCREAKKLASNKENCEFCNYCVYKLNSESDYSLHCLSSTYDEICYAKNAEDLYEAIQNRIKHLEETIEIYENRRLKDDVDSRG